MSNHTPKLDICYRLRHVRHVSLRRISTTDIPALFFTLHCVSPPHTLIYRSETHSHSRNPNWKKLPRSIFADTPACRESRFILRIWVTVSQQKPTNDKLLIEWNMDLNELVGIERHRVGVLTSPNLVLFGLRNAGKTNLLFTDKSLVEGLKIVTHELELPYSHDFTSSNTFLTTYTLTTLQTLVPLIGAVETEDRRKINLRAMIENQLKGYYERRRELDDLLQSINQLKRRKKEFTMVVEKKRSRFEDNTNEIQTHQSDVQLNIQEMKSNQLVLEDRRERHSSRKSNLVSKLNSITHRRLSLIQSLGSIYEIVIPPEPATIDASQEIFLPTIHGVPLPRQSTIIQTFIPDIGINTSLGFVVHLISLLELILRLPLRFPLLFYGSQSLIFNESTISGEEFREVPLYFKRRGDLSINKLEHALFLLNHDIIQVRQHLGLATMDFKATLKNLKSLFIESEICLQRLSRPRFAATESLFSQENQDSIDLIFNEVTDTEVNEFKDIELQEISVNTTS